MQILRAIGMLTTDPANELVRITRAKAKSGLSNGTEMSEAVNAINRAESRLTRQLCNLAIAPEKYDGAADISQWFGNHRPIDNRVRPRGGQWKTLILSP